ncbi:MAG TPA: hypothetical protein EYG49_11430 [Gammaproteobacteria bacterium]|nr:hypothetical protein [Gammaproteobacteria bacterium]
MNNYKSGLILLMSILVTSPVIAETMKYTGTLHATSVKSLMPLANGDGVLMVEASGIAALSGTPPSVLAVKCSGMGIVDPESKAKTIFYCSFTESEEDGFDVKGIIKDETGAFDVIGGSGKWTKAKGKGEFIQIIKTAKGSKNVFKVEITTP